MSEQIIKYIDLLLKNKKFQLAEEEILKFIDIKAPNPKFLNLLGLSRIGLGKTDLAIDCFKKALQIDKNNAYKLNLAFAYLKYNKKITAIKHFFHLLNENFFDFRMFKYLYFFSKNQKNKIKILELIILSLEKYKKYSFDIQTVNFLIFFIEKEEFYFVQRFCEQVLKKNENPIIYNILANAHFFDKNYELAEKYFHKSIKLDPLNYSFYFDLAEFYKSKGSIEESVDNYKKAIKLNKDLNGSLHRCYAYTKKYKDENDDHYKFLKSLFINKSLLENQSDINKMHFLFSMSKACEDLGKFKSAYEYFSRANLIASKIYPHNNSDLKRELDIIKKIFSELDIKNLMKHGFQNSLYKPIFIVGLPRSGSTLVEQIISSHSKVFSNGESKIFGKNLSHFFNTYDFDKFEDELSLITKDTEKIEKIGKLYIEKSIHKNKKFFFTDKMLFNFLYIGLIKICLPHSKIIICQRDYRDIFVSIIKNYFSETKMGFSFNEELVLDFILLYDSFIKFWKKKLGNLLFFNKYEQLVTNQEKQAKEIFNYCDLNWENDILNFNLNKNFVKTLSSSQVRSKIYQTSLQSWKNYEIFYSKIFEKLNKLQN